MSNPTDHDRMNYLTALAEQDRRQIKDVMEQEEGKPVPLCDHSVLAIDGTTCWGKTYREAVDRAMEHDNWTTP